MDRKEFQDALVALGSDRADEREDAAEHLADLFEYGRLSREDATRAVDAVLEAVCREYDSVVREAMMNVLVASSVRSEKLAVPWDQSASILDALDSEGLAHALGVLGNTQDTEFAAVLEVYLLHESTTAREAAREALVQLGTRS